jgi:hypothetical protein
MQSHSLTATATNGATVEIGTIEHEGRSFEALGAVIDTSTGLILGYPKHGNFNGVPHTLCTWDGKPLGPLAITGYARGFHGVKLTCYSFEYEGRRYTGRGLGDGMSVRLHARGKRA